MCIRWETMGSKLSWHLTLLHNPLSHSHGLLQAYPPWHAGHAIT